jgi:hypothetical protein
VASLNLIAAHVYQVVHATYATCIACVHAFLGTTPLVYYWHIQTVYFSPSCKRFPYLLLCCVRRDDVTLY